MKDNIPLDDTTPDPNNTEQETATSQRPTTEPQKELISVENHSDLSASQASQQGYRLTEDNYLSIDPLIGLTEEEIQHFFKN